MQGEQGACSPCRYNLFLKKNKEISITMAKKMRKVKIRNIVYILASIVTVSMIAIVVFFYWGANSVEKRQYESQIKQETQVFTDSLISELDQVNTSGPAVQTTNPGISTSEAPPEIVAEDEKKIISGELAKLNEEKKQQVLQTLSEAYSKAFSEQKAEALGIAARLIQEGKDEWAALKAKGEDTAVNKAKLASEYLAKANVAEAQMDASFYALQVRWRNN
jgi:nitrogen fixation-related uncharacterized protein